MPSLLRLRVAFLIATMILATEDGSRFYNCQINRQISDYFALRLNNISNLIVGHPLHLECRLSP